MRNDDQVYVDPSYADQSRSTTVLEETIPRPHIQETTNHWPNQHDDCAISSRGRCIAPNIVARFDVKVVGSTDTAEQGTTYQHDRDQRARP